MTAQISATHYDDIEVRRRAIMVGLSPFMSITQCQQAAHLWEQGYSHAPRFALQKFVKQLVGPDDPLWPFRHDMFINVTKITALSRAEIEARFARLFQEELDFGAMQPTVPDDIEAQPVFEQLFVSLLRLIESEDYPVAVRLRKFLREKMLRGESFSMDTQRLNSWLLGIHPSLEVSLSLERMREIIHHAYLGSCEYLGPVRADHLLAEAIQLVEKKTRGEGVSPRVFL